MSLQKSQQMSEGKMPPRGGSGISWPSSPLRGFVMQPLDWRGFILKRTGNFFTLLPLFTRHTRSRLYGEGAFKAPQYASDFWPLKQTE